MRSKTEKVTFRCTKETKLKLNEIARKDGISLSSYIEKAVLGYQSGDRKIKNDTGEVAALCRMASFVSRIEDGYRIDESMDALVQEVKEYVNSKING